MATLVITPSYQAFLWLPTSSGDLQSTALCMCVCAVLWVVMLSVPCTVFSACEYHLHYLILTHPHTLTPSQGYKQRNAYIATQGPLRHTVPDFWRMLWEFKSKTVVMLCNSEEEGEESAAPYWPAKENEMMAYGKINVTLQSKAAYGDFSVRKFTIMEDKVCVYVCVCVCMHVC